MPAKSVTYKSQNYAGTLGSGLIIGHHLFLDAQTENLMKEISQ